MPKERTEPTTDESGEETHPAFGVISLHRIHSTPGEVLFQSDIPHSEYVQLQIHEATRQRDLKHDWVHPGKMICEVSMSMAQFASFVVSGGTQGPPCTIEFTGGGRHGTGHRPGLNLAPRLHLTSDEVRSAANDAFASIKQAFRAYGEALGEVGKGSAAARRTALRNLECAISNAAPNVAYATKQLDTHAEAVVEKSRADIEAMVVRTAERLGISPSEVPAIES